MLHLRWFILNIHIITDAVLEQRLAYALKQHERIPDICLASFQRPKPADGFDNVVVLAFSTREDREFSQSVGIHLEFMSRETVSFTTHPLLRDFCES